jgi:PAS domain S-box-containing protein
MAGSAEGSLARLFELSLDMLGTASADGYFAVLNPAWQRTLGWTNEELTAQPLLGFVHPDDIQMTRQQMAKLGHRGGPWDVGFENRYRTKLGDYRWLQWNGVASDGVLYFVAKDVTDQKAAVVDRDQAASVMQAIVDSVADGLCATDTTGRLTYVNPAAVRLLGYGSAADLLGRDPHATFHHSRRDGSPNPEADCPMLRVRHSRQAAQVEEDVFWRRDGTALPVSYSSAAIDLSDGTGCVVAFRDITALQAERERLRAQVGDLAWFEDVRRAITEDRLVLYGQPIVDLISGAVVKIELLLRMLSSSGQIVAPGLFLPAAEKYGLIDDIDRWVISKAIQMAGAGQAVAINLSASSVGSPEVLAHIEDELGRTGAAPELLTFEVTETAVMKDIQAGRRFADRLVTHGCSFALDDFGTGFGSLTYLRQLPFAYLKIDVQFVREMPQSAADQKLVQAIVHIADTFGQKTVAEGVEDERTLVLLREFGVDYAQGYHLGRPAPVLASTI